MIQTAICRKDVDQLKLGDDILRQGKEYKVSKICRYTVYACPDDNPNDGIIVLRGLYKTDLFVDVVKRVRNKRK